MERLCEWESTLVELGLAVRKALLASREMSLLCLAQEERRIETEQALEQAEANLHRHLTVGLLEPQGTTYRQNGRRG